MKTLMKILVLFLFCRTALADYDLTLTGINDFNTPMSYSNISILIASDAFVRYSGLTLQNCTLDIDGSGECVSNLTLNDSIINVEGNFRGKPGLIITETGSSSIVATGDSQNEGKLTLEGAPRAPITAYSDYAPTDANFIVFGASCSPSSSLKFVNFHGGWSNVVTQNKRLNDAISNCCFFGADYAVYQEGPDEFTDVRFSFFYGNSQTSIFANMSATGCSYPEMWVDNVQIDNASGEDAYGIGLNLAPDEYYYGFFKMTNSIITNCYCGWGVGSGSYIAISLSNVAYYNNIWNNNWGDTSGFETNKILLSESPFEGPAEWSWFIKPNSPVAEVNLPYDLGQNAPQQLLTSLYMNSAPRSDKGIGFGVPIPLEVNVGDLDGNCKVNSLDFAKLAMDWRTIKGVYPIHFPDFDGYSIADFDKNGTVDEFDLAAFCANWLSTIPAPGIELTVSNSEDLLTVTCQNVPDLDISYYAFFLDGKYIASRDPNSNPTLVIDKRRYQKGKHSLIAVIRVADGNEYLTATKAVVFNSALHDLAFDELFDPSNYYIIKGKVDSGYFATVTIKDIEGQNLWSGTYDEDFIASAAPSTFSAGKVSYEITYSYQQGMLLSGGSSGSGSALALDGPPDNRTAGLVICMLEEGMNEGTSQYDTGSCRFAARMMQKRGVVPITLLGYGTNNQVTKTMLKKVFRKYPKIRYMHIFAHGNYRTGFIGFRVQRTILQFNDGVWPAHNSTMWTGRRMTVPADYDYLSSNLEKAPCLANLPFDSDQLRIVVLESCYAARTVATENADWTVNYIDGAYEWELEHNVNRHPTYPYSDICFALMMYNSKQMVLGSGSVVIGGWYTYYRQFFNTFWNQLGDGESAESAIDEAIKITTIEVLNNFRIRGVAYTPEIYLKTNP